MVYLRAREVSLEFPMEAQHASRADASFFRSTMAGSTRRYVTVLSRLSFAAEEGDRVALMGLNGAGKTTLLRVLNGAFLPSTGTIESRGLTQSLLNATLGFAEYATVIENVMLRGTAMGLRLRQIQGVLGDILDFAGLTDRASHRLHTLSAGQRMRLGFAISTAIQPDILLMDEWIATGDAVFVERARNRLTGRINGSRIVVLASHSAELQKRLCNKALVLDKGRMRYYGDIDEGVSVYRSIVSAAGAELRAQVAANDPLLFGSSSGMIERVRIVDRRIELEGWAIDERGREVAVVCVEAGGAKGPAAPERVDREDVRLYLAKGSGRFGFRVSLPAPEDQDAEDLLRGLRVSAGSSMERLGAPLPMAKAAVVEVC